LTSNENLDNNIIELDLLDIPSVQSELFCSLCSRELFLDTTQGFFVCPNCKKGYDPRIQPVQSKIMATSPLTTSAGDEGTQELTEEIQVGKPELVAIDDTDDKKLQEIIVGDQLPPELEYLTDLGRITNWSEEYPLKQQKRVFSENEE